MGLIGWWKLDGNVKDSSARGNHGILVGSYDFVDAKTGKGIEFLSSEGRVDTDLSDIGSEFSFSVWIKKLTSDWLGIAILGKRNSDTGWMLYRNSGDSTGYFRWYMHYETEDNNVNSFVGWPGISNIQVGEWYHIAITRSSKGVSEIYVNGDKTREDGPPSDFKRWVLNSESLSIGSQRSGSSSWSARDIIIDDIRIYNHALSLKEVKELSRAKVSHWKMNTLNNGVVVDSSGYGNDGAVQGADFTSDVKIGSGSLYFDEGDRVDADIDTGDNNEISVSAWIKPEVSSDSRAPIVRIDRWYFQVYNDNRLATYWYGRSSAGYHYSTSNSIPMDVWSHVCVVWSDSDVKFYINGTLDNTISSVTGKGDRNEWVRLGYESSSRRYKGIIDDVRIYTSVLTSDDIEELYKQRASLDNKGNYFAQEHSEIQGTIPDYSWSTYAGVDDSFSNVEDDYIHVFNQAFSSSTNSGASTNIELTNVDKLYISLFYRTWRNTTGGNDETGRLRIFIDSTTELDFSVQMPREEDSISRIIEIDTSSYSGTNELDFRLNDHSSNEGESVLYVYDIMKNSSNSLTKEGIQKSLISEVGPGTGLLGWWDFNKGSDNTATDIASGNDGNIVEATFVKGLTGNALRFLKSDEAYMETSTDEKLNLKEKGTVSVWVKILDTPTDDWTNIVSNTQTAGHSAQSWNIVSRSNGEIRTRITNEGGNTNHNHLLNPEFDRWYHLTMTWESEGGSNGIVKGYVDGEEVHSNSYTGLLRDNDDKVVLMSYTNHSRYNEGEIDSVRVYNRALTAEEVKVLYDVTRPDGPRMKQSPKRVYAKEGLHEL